MSAALSACVSVDLPLQSEGIALAISSALIQTPSRSSFVNAEDLREPFDPARRMHDNSGLKRLLPHCRRGVIRALACRPILCLVLLVLGGQRQTPATALGKSFPANLLQGILASRYFFKSIVYLLSLSRIKSFTPSAANSAFAGFADSNTVSNRSRETAFKH
ncbi:hypothetical protein JZX86_04285 [Agrobacterium rosae]|uniref:hypothetical protein n=1 Tax=Agrobacterium rosae TaxID=1972867 RepID=UPI0019D33D04|nr:hypothetical protein [Agrobacterium rosae]MBN7804579.1 hypothetical protein [Agrobacterium rosae]